jgi:hypothetical protein
MLRCDCGLVLCRLYWRCCRWKRGVLCYCGVFLCDVFRSGRRLLLCAILQTGSDCVGFESCRVFWSGKIEVVGERTRKLIQGALGDSCWTCRDLSCRNSQGDARPSEVLATAGLHILVDKSPERLASEAQKDRGFHCNLPSATLTGNCVEVDL